MKKHSKPPPARRAAGEGHRPPRRAAEPIAATHVTRLNQTVKRGGNRVKFLRSVGKGNWPTSAFTSGKDLQRQTFPRKSQNRNSSAGKIATAPILAVAAMGDVPQVQRMLGQKKRTADLLIPAIKSGQRKLLRWLISQGLDANLPNEKGATPLHIAASAGNLAMAKLLVKHGANV